MLRRIFFIIGDGGANGIAELALNVVQYLY